MSQDVSIFTAYFRKNQKPPCAGLNCHSHQGISPAINAEAAKLAQVLAINVLAVYGGQDVEEQICSR